MKIFPLKKLAACTAYNLYNQERGIAMLEIFMILHRQLEDDNINKTLMRQIGRQSIIPCMAILVKLHSINSNKKINITAIMK